MTGRPTSRSTITLGTACVIALTIGVAALMRFTQGVDAVFFGECVFYGVLMAWLARRPEITRWLRGDDARYGRLIVVFVALLIAGQIVADSRKSYPFVTWAMYSPPARETPVFLECHGVRADGSEVVIPVAQLFESLGVRLTRSWLKLAEKVLDETDPGEQIVIWRRFDQLVKSMSLEYNRMNPEFPVVEAVVWRVMVPAHDRSKSVEYPREMFRRITVIEGDWR